MSETDVHGAVFVGASLDGQIARADGSIDWLTGTDEITEETSSPPDDSGYDEFFASVDALAMGRASYETVLGFDIPWPYGDKPVLVLSTTLHESPIPSVSIHPTLGELLAAAEGRGLHRLYVDGGKTIQTFLQAGLIREITITTLPILIGAGTPLFADLPEDIQLEHLDTRALAKGLVQSKYGIPGA